ncbi:hypothetical protein U1Q18_021542 [Sarracenia purpurea var. burkii]
MEDLSFSRVRKATIGFGILISRSNFSVRHPNKEPLEIRCWEETQESIKQAKMKESKFGIGFREIIRYGTGVAKNHASFGILIVFGNSN